MNNADVTVKQPQTRIWDRKNDIHTDSLLRLTKFVFRLSRRRLFIPFRFYWDL